MDSGFVNDILRDVQALIGPLITVIKGVFNILAKIFSYLASILQNPPAN